MRTDVTDDRAGAERATKELVPTGAKNAALIYIFVPLLVGGHADEETRGGGEGGEDNGGGRRGRASLSWGS